MACLLVIASAYLAVRSAGSRRRGELVAASAGCLALSALTAVSFAIYIPAVAAIGLCAWAGASGWQKALAAAAWHLAAAAAMTGLGMTAMHMWRDALGSTVARQHGLGQGVSLVVRAAWSWDGLLVCVAGAGVILAFCAGGARSPRAWLMAACGFAGILVPLYQAHIGTGFSMDKHISAGTALAALAAGYAVSRIPPLGISPRAAAAVSVTLLAFSSVTGLWYARSAFQSWPDTAPLLKEAAAFAAPGPVLVNSTDGNFNVSIFRYYSPSEEWADNSPGMPEFRSGTYSEVIHDLDAAKLEAASVPEAALTAGAGLKEKILAAAGDSKLISELEASRRYAIAGILPYATSDSANASGVFVIWKRVPAPAVRRLAHGKKS